MNGAGKEEKPSDDSSVELSQDELEDALNGKTSPPESAEPPADVPETEESDINIVKERKFEDFDSPEMEDSGQNIEMLLDVTLPVAIELGRTSMPIEKILNLGPGSVVELNRLAGEPVDLLVNDKLIAKGEVVVVDENFGVRITTMISKEERLKGLV